MSEVKFVSKFIDLFFPQKCISCGKIIEIGKSLCEECEKGLEEIPHKGRCEKCGLEKTDCDCKYNVYYFNGVVSCFYNTKTARGIVYRYKLFGKPYYAKYISHKMVEKLREEMPNAKFDFVTFVPTTYKNKTKRGFDQAYLLAKEISKEFGIPLVKNIIGVKPFSKAQHKMKKTKRFENVENKYFVKSSANGKKALLIDDIKTSGATLSICSKQLLLSGVEEVYCLTALAGKKGKKTQK